MLIDLGATYDQFIKVAKYGLEAPGKENFEQIIACENYIYFKNLMVTRNLQLEEESYELMYKQMSKSKNTEVSKKMMKKGIFEFLSRP